MLIALAIGGFGYTRFALRLVPAIAGMLLVLVAGLLGRRLFRSDLAGLVAAALVCADGFLVTYSRTAHLDGLVALGVVATIYLAFRSPSAGAIAAASVVAGLTCAIKFTGITLLAPIALAILSIEPGERQIRKALLAAGSLATVVSVYVLAESWGLRTGGQPSGAGDVLAHTRALVRHHAELTHWAHPLTSSYVSWLVPVRPIVIWEERIGADTRMVFSMGNPIAWWLVSLGFVCALGSQTWRGIREPFLALWQPAPEEGSFLARYQAAILVLTMGFVAVISPWFLTHRDSYIYHYLPAYALGQVGLAGFLAHRAERGNRSNFVLLGGILVAAVLFAPLAVGWPVPTAYLDALLFTMR